MLKDLQELTAFQLVQGGVCLQVATRGLFSLKPPRIVVPKVIVPGVENLFNAFRALDNAELDHKLIGLEVRYSLALNILTYLRLRSLLISVAEHNFD